MRARRTFAALTAAVGLTSAMAAARGQQPLPSFNVQAPSGAAAASVQLTRASQWVLVYIAPGHKPSHDLLEALGQWQVQANPARVVVIVRGSLADAAALIDKIRPDATAAPAWYADPSNAAWQALNLRSTPALIGVRDGVMQWTISGVLNDPKMVEPVIRNWVGQ